MKYLLAFPLILGCIPKKSDTKTIEEKEKEEIIREMIESEDMFEDLPESDTGDIER